MSFVSDDPAGNAQATLRRLLWPWLLLFVPVALVDIQYPALPSQLPVLRDWSGNVEAWGPKSFMVAFRVPLMGVVLAMIVSLMWWHAQQDGLATRRRASAGFWIVLLYAVAFKSLGEGLEFVAGMAGVAHAEFTYWCWLATLAAVIGGFLLALVPGWQWWTGPAPMFRPLPMGVKLALMLLLALYAGFAFWPNVAA